MTERRLEARLVHTIKAAVWMFGGRGLGLAWTIFLIHQFGIADYGRYAMAFACAMLIAPIDYYFFVGSVRSSDEVFRRDRASRCVAGIILLVIGLALYQSSFVVGFGFALAGGSAAFNAVQSTWMRAGRPDKLTSNLTLRQAACITCAVAYSVVTGTDNLELACLAYLVPFLPSAARGAYLLRHDRPQWPRGRSRTGMILLDAITLATYHQLDILFLGTAVSEEAAGYYSAASVTSFAAAAIGGSYAQTFHEPLRASGGDPATGPPRHRAWLMGTALGVVVFVVGLVLLALDTSAQLWGSFLILGPVTALTYYKHCLVVVLMIQNRDATRVATVAGCLAVKVALLVGLTLGLGWGALGAATAALLAEGLLVSLLSSMVHGRHALTTTAVDSGEGR